MHGLFPKVHFFHNSFQQSDVIKQLSVSNSFVLVVSLCAHLSVCLISLLILEKERVDAYQLFMESNWRPCAG